LGFAVVVTALAVAACKGADARLEILRTDPMADVQLPGALDVKVSVFAGSLGPGVTAPASITHTFTMPPGGVPAAIESLADQARAADWDLQERAASGYSGEKTVGGLISTITIAGRTDNNQVWVIILTHDS
jgi:hypothetical protein